MKVKRSGKKSVKRETQLVIHKIKFLIHRVKEIQQLI